MSLAISPEVEAHIVALAREAGLSVEEYLERLITENRELAAAMRGLMGSAELLPPEEVRLKIERGLAQLERGEYVDGEEFMENLLADLNNAEGHRPAG
jgi:predicted transcriptional regulator